MQKKHLSYITPRLVCCYHSNLKDRLLQLSNDIHILISDFYLELYVGHIEIATFHDMICGYIN